MSTSSLRVSVGRRLLVPALCCNLRRLARGAGPLVLSVTAACATSSAPRVARLRIEAMPAEAAVFLDDRFVGRASEWAAPPGREIPLGFHRIELRLPDHHSYYTEITATAGAGLSIEAILHARLD